MPFYMAYPLAAYFEEQEGKDKDLEYMKSLYPYAAKRIQRLIDEELQLRDYKTSSIYDEYPDRLMLRMLVRSIYDKAKDIENIEYLSDLVEVLLYEELIRRRARNLS
jgi:hypothetical protein